jgi:sugar O-acyltransferase (sialic acid O-acetyltransferase NeuD family)
MIIYGAGSLGKIILAELINNQFPYGDVVFFDENKELPEYLYNKYRVIKSPDELKTEIKNGNELFFPAVGNPRKREKITERLELSGGKLISIISSGAYISPLNDNRFEGLFAPLWSGISHNTTIEKSCILHHYTAIGHDVVIGKYASISPGVQVCSFSSIGDYCFIGTGAIISTHIKVGNNVVIGAGALVTRDLNDYETYIAG